jgi:hypothetical protein
LSFFSEAADFMAAGVGGKTHRIKKAGRNPGLFYFRVSAITLCAAVFLRENPAGWCAARKRGMGARHGLKIRIKRAA